MGRVLEYGTLEIIDQMIELAKLDIDRIRTGSADVRTFAKEIGNQT